MNTSVKIFLACAIGALIGCLIALRIDSAGWWVGALAGSLIGYFCYDIRTVFQAIPKAWGAVTGFRMTRQQWERTKVVAWGLALVVSWVVTFMLTMLLALKPSSVIVSMGNVGFFSGLALGLLSCGNLVGYCLALHAFFQSFNKERIWGIDEAWQRFLIYNPIMAHTYWLLRGVCIAAKKSPIWIPMVVMPILKFVLEFLRIIHSNVRLLCGVDAMLGACIGYYCHNALVGALAGGVFGVLNYEILSKRVFHIVPDRTS
jgi:hypothetical protein